MAEVIKLHEIPKSETYFAIPNDLSSLKGLTVLEYLKRHVWLSHKRERECRTVFNVLVQENFHMSVVMPDFLKEFQVEEYSPKNERISICFLHKGLLQLFRVMLSTKIVDELLLLLEHAKLQFECINFREWCVISAFAERFIFAGPFKCSVLEFADFQHYKEHGEAFAISPALRKALDIIDFTHNMPATVSDC